MEYLSLPHTRASSYKLVPEVDDTLLTNLRNPIITLVEDTSPGAHDTLTAACDANLYASLGVDKPAEHGSCAENLVLALKELNENAGLKGAKAVGADISVNIAPTPLHLFMVTPIELASDVKTTEAGAKGAKLAVEEPKGKKRSFVRFRAERDVVVVLSACPNDVGRQNGGRCMAANFMVEDESNAPSGEARGKSNDSEKKAEKKAEKAKPKKLNAPNERGEDKRAERGEPETQESNDEPKREQAEAKPAEEKQATPQATEEKKTEEKTEEPEEPEVEEKKTGEKTGEKTEEKPEEKTEEKTEDKTDDKGSNPSSEAASEEAPKPKKKPKKLQVRSKQ
jgi:uncharacterized protein YcgI (DUF1989 family)